MVNNSSDETNISDDEDNSTINNEPSSNWEGWSRGDHIAIDYHVDPAGGALLGKASESNTTNSNDHLHFYDNPGVESIHHKPDHEVGARLVEDKQTSYISEDLFNGVKNFFGW